MVDGNNNMLLLCLGFFPAMLFVAHIAFEVPPLLKEQEQYLYVCNVFTQPANINTDY